MEYTPLMSDIKATGSYLNLNSTLTKEIVRSGVQKDFLELCCTIEDHSDPLFGKVEDSMIWSVSYSAFVFIFVDIVIGSFQDVIHELQIVFIPDEFPSQMLCPLHCNHAVVWKFQLYHLKWESNAISVLEYFISSLQVINKHSATALSNFLASREFLSYFLGL